MNRYKFDAEKHLHLLDGKPLSGCSSIVGILNKPLSWWASGKAVEFLGWKHGKPKVNGKYVTTPIAERISNAQPVLDEIKKMDVKTYIELLDRAYKNHSVKLEDSAQAGIDLHAELEKYVKSCIEGKPLGELPIEQILPFTSWASLNVKRFLWSEAYCYSEPLWTGGISDFGCELIDGSYAVGDFKSSKAAYTSHFLQDAGYGVMIEENGLFDKDGNSLTTNGDFLARKFEKVIVVPFGAYPVVPVTKMAQQFKDGFKHAVALYRLINQEEN